MKIFQAVDLNKPVDKKLYKGTNPTCHNFNQTTATADSAPLLVGFSTGQIQLIDPIKKELSKLYNEDVRDCKNGTWYNPKIVRIHLLNVNNI
ncbi:hypothetical protein E2986_11170 [Frieseomelitta varia]|uniref:Uncharacterized protein n=1 Tax=Frieseomelitta varia TaxID=561572 RepID=A0A833S417_9HYME|nr:hypothetical protein E2986_11170 [Frieseomelitta varia]